MKYVIVLSQFGSEQAILFPETLAHAEVAHAFRRSVKSAGFCELDDEWYAWGRSESLGIDSRPEDTNVLKRSFPEL